MIFSFPYQSILCPYYTPISAKKTALYKEPPAYAGGSLHFIFGVSAATSGGGRFAVSDKPF